MGKYYHQHTILYHNGAFVKATEASMDLYSQSIHYGYCVFEGIRAYKTVNGTTKIFKAAEHYSRLAQSAAALNMPYHWTEEELIHITYSLLEQNALQDAYIRPVVYAPANMHFTQNDQSFLFIQVWEMQPFLGEKLIRVMTSSFQRPNPAAFRIYAKAAGHYVNSILASQEAKAAGYDEALLTDMHGYAAEAPGANLFYEKEGVLYTPALGHILPGITRATVMDLCEKMNIPVVEKNITLEELKQGNAAFYCGTAAEIVGIKSIDDVEFPMPWSNTVAYRIQQAYKALVTENDEQLQTYLAKKMYA